MGNKPLIFLTYPSRDDKGIVITDNIVFKPNAYMIQVYATLDKIKSGSTTSGELDAEGFEQTFEFTHPGSEIEIREFKANWLSRNIGVIVLHCHSTRKDQFGTPCEPMRMVAKWEDDKDKNKDWVRKQWEKSISIPIVLPVTPRIGEYVEIPFMRTSYSYSTDDKYDSGYVHDVR